MAAATDGKQAVIRSMKGAEESANQRMLRKHIPAWVISGAVHVALAVTMIAADKFMGSPTQAAMSLSELTVVAQNEEKESTVDLTNPDVGIDPELPAVVEADKLDTVNVQDATKTEDNPGIADATSNDKKDYIPLPGIGTTNDGGVTGDAGKFLTGGGGGGEGVIAADAFKGRGAATRSKMLQTGGGNTKSEAAVAKGLLWLVKQQKGNGSWVYDGTARGDTCSATALAMLPFLAAGQTHKSTAKDNKYKANVEAGMRYLLSLQKPDGSFKNASDQYMYSHAIATVAICELLGMSGDKSLVPHAQKAVNYILSAQGANGSWGYTAGKNGDTSIVGWQIQALQSAKLCKELTVDKRSFEKARKFLDAVASGPNKSEYGYDGPAASKTLTPVGLLCRYYADGWGPNNPGMASGVASIMKKQQPTKAYMNIYYYYYATQVMHFFEGKEWYEQWNPAMRDMLIDLQIPDGKNNSGSWDADGEIFGEHTGRLGMTCLSMLTLEVYYRHLPLYKRDTGGLKELERVR
jgi:Prenyltransferase and squalene oxidase repeat